MVTVKMVDCLAANPPYIHTPYGLELQADGISVARLSQEAQQTWQPLLARTRRIKVIAMVVRYRDDSQTDYQARCRVESWEISMVEWVYG